MHLIGKCIFSCLFGNSQKCKEWGLEFEKAAPTLSRRNPPTYLAKVDGTKEKRLSAKYKINGYPTTLWFANGVDTDYQGIP